MMLSQTVKKYHSMNIDQYNSSITLQKNAELYSYELDCTAIQLLVVLCILVGLYQIFMGKCPLNALKHKTMFRSDLLIIWTISRTVRHSSEVPYANEFNQTTSHSLIRISLQAFSKWEPSRSFSPTSSYPVSRAVQPCMWSSRKFRLCSRSKRTKSKTFRSPCSM